MFDPVLLLSWWNDFEFYNALKEICPASKIYLNAPFGDQYSFWLWMIYMHGRHGASISCLAAWYSTNNISYKRYMPSFIKRKNEPNITFVGHVGPLQKALCSIELN